MGLGKSAIAIQASMHLNKILVICPAIAKFNWQNEFMKFAQRKSYVSGKGKTLHKQDIVIVSFNFLVRHLGSYATQKWDVVIVDEVHMLKSPTALRTTAVFGQHGILHHTKRLWAMSGTPAPNHAGELWVMLYSFGYTTLSYDGFINRYCICQDTGGRYSNLRVSGTNTRKAPELKNMLRGMAIRRLKKDVLDLPPIFHNNYYIEGDDHDAILERHPELQEKLEIELELIKEKIDFEHETSDNNLLNTLQMLGQSISSLRRYHGFKKIKDTTELIDFELSCGLCEKLIVFGIHTDVLNTLRDGLSKHKSVIITGKTTDNQRKRAVYDFQNDKKTKIFFGNILAAGTAITLTAAKQVIFIENDWVPGNNQQAADRAHRIGQKESVNVRHITIKDSLDSKIMGVLIRKIREISTFI